MYKVKMINRKTGESMLSIESFESRTLAAKYIVKVSQTFENIDYSIVEEHTEMEETEEKDNAVDKELWSNIYHRFQYSTKPMMLRTKPSVIYVDFKNKKQTASYVVVDSKRVCDTCDEFYEICKCKAKRKGK